MNLNKIELDYWQSYLKSNAINLSSANVEASIAGNDAIADHLLELYLSGKKTAGSSLAKDYEYTGEEYPKVGNYWIILDSKKIPKCIVRTKGIEKFKFAEVPLKVAISEGEGDLSLEYWRKAHINFFTPYLKKWGIANLDQEELITEYYKLVYK